MPCMCIVGLSRVHRADSGQQVPIPGRVTFVRAEQPLRVQVPNDHILAQNLYYNCYCPNPKYLNIGYLDP